MIKISIIIPVYNIENYIERCIKSILTQDYKNLELLLIDDGSTDNSYNICQYYSNLDIRIKCFTKENEGVSQTRNFGISLATGDYIMFVDGDDFIHQSFFININKIKNLNDYDFVMWGLNLYDGKKIYKQLNIKNSCLELSKYKKYPEWFNSPVNKLIKKSFLIKNKISFPEGITLAEDMYFSYCCYFYSEKSLLIPQPFYYYDTSRSTSTCNSITKSKILDEFQSIILLESKDEFKNNLVLRRSLKERKKSAKIKYLYQIRNIDDIIIFKTKFKKISIFFKLNFKYKLFYLLVIFKLSFFINVLIKIKK